MYIISFKLPISSNIVLTPVGLYSIRQNVPIWSGIVPLPLLTCTTVTVYVSRLTSTFTFTGIFVTRRVIQTVPTTVVNTVKTIGPDFTLYNRQ